MTETTNRWGRRRRTSVAVSTSRSWNEPELQQRYKPTQPTRRASVHTRGKSPTIGETKLFQIADTHNAEQPESTVQPVATREGQLRSIPSRLCADKTWTRSRTPTRNQRSERRGFLPGSTKPAVSDILSFSPLPKTNILRGYVHHNLRQWMIPCSQVPVYV